MVWKGHEHSSRSQNCEQVATGYEFSNSLLENSLLPIIAPRSET